MSLSTHLHQWLHPRDPLLEAWKDDPFVEMMVAREKRARWAPGGIVAGIVIRRWGCLSVLAVTVVIYVMLVIIELAMNIGLNVGFWTLIAVLGSILILREALMILRRHFLHNARLKASLMVLLQATGSNPDVLDLWLAGVRGRDMVKALHVILCRRPMKEGLWFFCSFVAMAILMWGPISRVGVVGAISYILLLVWFRLLHIYIRSGQENPLRSVSNRFVGVPPNFLSRALDACRPSYSEEEWRGPSILAAILVLLGVLLPIIPRNLAEPQLVGPIGLLGIQVACLLAANIIMLCHRLGPGLHFHELLEGALQMSDLEFDLHVREHIIQDPDARLRSS